MLQELCQLAVVAAAEFIRDDAVEIWSVLCQAPECLERVASDIAYGGVFKEVV